MGSDGWLRWLDMVGWPGQGGREEVSTRGRREELRYGELRDRRTQEEAEGSSEGAVVEGVFEEETSGAAGYPDRSGSPTPAPAPRMTVQQTDMDDWANITRNKQDIAHRCW